MTETTITAARAVAVEQPAAVRSQGRRLRRRHLWIIPGFAIAIAANLLGERHGVGILALIGFGLAPHLPLLLRLGGQPLGRRLASLSIPAFNVLHHPVAALAAVAWTAVGGVTGIVPMVALVASLVWFSHIVIGWGVGDVIRRPEVRQ